MSNRTQFEPNYLRESALIIYVNLQLTVPDSLSDSFLNLNCVMTTPKRRSFNLILNCFIHGTKFLLLDGS